MRYLIPMVLLLSLLCSCAAKKQTAATPMPIKDSIRTEVHYQYLERIDTVRVTLPTQRAEVTIPDTTSTLENDYAKSTATILSNGLLYHTLETKLQPVLIPVKTTSERRDSVATRKIEVPKPYPVEVERELTQWQKFRLKGFWVLLSIIIAAIGWRWRKPIFNFIRRFI